MKCEQIVRCVMTEKSKRDQVWKTLDLSLRCKMRVSVWWRKKRSQRRKPRGISLLPISLVCLSVCPSTASSKISHRFRNRKNNLFPPPPPIPPLSRRNLIRLNRRLGQNKTIDWLIDIISTCGRPYRLNYATDWERSVRWARNVQTDDGLVF